MAIFLAFALLVLVPREDGELPIRSAFPFNTKVSPKHEIGYFLQSAAICYGLFLIVCMDSMVTEMGRWINFRMRILTSNFRMCESKQHDRGAFYQTDETFKFIKNTSIYQITDEHQKIRSFIPMKLSQVNNFEDSYQLRFKTCLQNHQDLIHAVDDLNTIFGSSMLMQLFASFSMICLTGFQAVLVSYKFFLIKIKLPIKF